MNTDKLEINNRKLDAATAADPRHAGGKENREIPEARALYATQLAAHFQSYVDWAVDHWPAADIALGEASFERSRQDLQAICRQLGLPEPGRDVDPSAPGAAQFVPVAPMPWP
jgi:hypothetical protein